MRDLNQMELDLIYKEEFHQKGRPEQDEEEFIEFELGEESRQEDALRREMQDEERR